MKKEIIFMVIVTFLLVFLIDFVVSQPVYSFQSKVNITKDCKTRYWETEEPIYGTCQREYTITVCNGTNNSCYNSTKYNGTICNESINKSCHNKTRYYNYTCKIGTKTVQHNETICTPTEIEIETETEKIKIKFKEWGMCSYEKRTEDIIVICDSRYDGNNDGICQSGESCVKFVVTQDKVERFLKNSQDEFTKEDGSFFLDELEYEVKES